jgi:hypothetical protein
MTRKKIDPDKPYWYCALDGTEVTGDDLIDCMGYDQPCSKLVKNFVEVDENDR